MSERFDVMAVRNAHPTWDKQQVLRVAGLRAAWLDGGPCGSRPRMKAWIRYRLACGERFGVLKRCYLRAMGWWPDV